ncbi:MAG TPA: SigE family RNA polymerase sigma factor [Micromonosporaceae bacterium]
MEVHVTYEEFVAARLQPLLRFAVMLTGDPHLAQDLVQDTMVRVRLQWRRVAATDQPEWYVKRMLTNAYVDVRRGSWLRRVVLRADPDESLAAPDRLPEQAAVDRDELWSLLNRLPRRQRAALVLRYYEALSDTEIAAVLDCAVGTVRSLISRALATLRGQLRPAPAGVVSESD